MWVFVNSKESMDPLELELEASGSYLAWVLGTELGEPELLLTANSSAFVLNHRAVIPVLPFATKILYNSALLIGNYRGVYTIHR